MESFLSGASDNVFCVHEPHPDLFDISIKKFRAGDSAKEIRQLILKARLSILKAYLSGSKNVYIESNPFASFLVDELKAIFPNAKFVIIYRDIDSYLLSALNKSPQSNRINDFYGDSDNRVRIRPSDFDADSSIESWNQYSRAQKITWYWNKCNQHLLSFSQIKNSHPVLSLKFEAFFSEDTTERATALKEMLNFMEIECSDQKINELLAVSKEKKNATKDVHFSSYNELSESERNWIARFTHELRSQLGYNKSINDLV